MMTILTMGKAGQPTMGIRDDEATLENIIELVRRAHPGVPDNRVKVFMEHHCHDARNSLGNSMPCGQVSLKTQQLD